MSALKPLQPILINTVNRAVRLIRPNALVRSTMVDVVHVLIGNVFLNTYKCLTCELSCLLALQRFAAREMWSFHRTPSRREPTVCFARPSRLRLHRSALTSLSKGCPAFGNLASGSQNLCLSYQQESTLCHKIIGVGTTECGRHQKRISYNICNLPVCNRSYSEDRIANGLFFC